MIRPQSQTENLTIGRSVHGYLSFYLTYTPLAMRAINALSLANFLYGSRKVSFDIVIETMYHAGKDLSPLCRETFEGGLAKLYSDKKA